MDTVLKLDMDVKKSFSNKEWSAVFLDMEKASLKGG